MARLRIFGEPVPDPRLLPATIDLAALENGAAVTDSSNSFYNSAANLIMPGLARVMGDGWETSTRRDQGHDWVAVQLACAGAVEVVELDTSRFVGNAPGWASLRGDGGDLVPRTALQPDTRHRFAVPGAPVAEQARLDIYPDGGLARLRVLGRPRPGRAGRAGRAGSSTCCPGPSSPRPAAGRPACRRPRRPGGRPHGPGLDDLPPSARALFRFLYPYNDKLFPYTKTIAGAHHGHHLRRQPVRQGGGPPGARHPRR